MFLNYLGAENKERFLKLCMYAAEANGIIDKEEKEAINVYCREMDIPETIPETKEPIENLLEEINNNANDAEKNIITLEILGLVKADKVYDEKEKAFMKKLIQSIGVKDGTLSKLNSLLDIYTVVCKELYAAVTE